MIPNLAYLYAVNARIDDWDCSGTEYVDRVIAQAQGHLDSRPQTQVDTTTLKAAALALGI
jgi:hypothetical protein